MASADTSQDQPLQAFVTLTVKLGSSLRTKAPGFIGGEGACRLPVSGHPRVSDVMAHLGLTADDVNLIYLNHVAVVPEAPVAEGDRLAFFPPNFIHFSQFYIKRKET